MPVKKRSNEPQHVSEGVWYYEDRGHLYFVVDCPGLFDKKKAHAFKVPVSMIQRSMSRYATPKKKRKTK